MNLVIGDLMLDVLLLPELKHEEQYGGMLARSGGSAANTAAWMAHLESDVTFVGCVGGDGVGKMLQDELSAEGVLVMVRSVQGMETGCVAVNLDGSGERLMRSSRGANVDLLPGDIVDAGLGAPVNGVHITGYALLSTSGYALLDAAARIARDCGAVLSFDPSSVGAIVALGRRRLLDALSGCGAGLLLPNRIEAEALTGETDGRRAALALARVVPTVLVKHGADGAVFAANGEAREVPTQPVQPVDTTGAGDAFNAGALVALQRGDELYAACQFANEIARQVISAYGGRPAHFQRAANA